MVCCLIGGSSLFAQQEPLLLRGIVTGEGTPLEMASVYLTSASDTTRLLTFTNTEATGRFELAVPDSLDRIVVVCNYLGFEEFRCTYVVDYLPDTLFLKLIPSVSEISTITFMGEKRAAVRRQDTVVYEADKFADSTEVSVEDLLRKLPGVEIGAQGEITINGKPIQKLLVEGTDMFGRGYTVGSKNIPAEVIEQIEVIDNYDENPVLKRMRDSERLVINLKFKEAAKNVIAGQGRMAGGYGAEFKGVGEVTGYSIGKRNKFLLISNNGNTGDQYDLNYLRHTRSFSNEDFLMDPIPGKSSFSAPVRPNYLGVKRSYVDNSINTFNSFRTFLQLDPANVFKFNTTFATKKEGQQYRQQLQLLGQESRYTNLFSRELALFEHLGEASVQHTANFGEGKRYLESFVRYRTDFNRGNQSDKSNLEKLVRENNRSKNQSVVATTRYTHRLGERSALIVSGKLTWLSLNEVSETSNPDFREILGPDIYANELFRQMIDHRRIGHRLQVEHRYRFRNIWSWHSTVHLEQQNSRTELSHINRVQLTDRNYGLQTALIGNFRNQKQFTLRIHGTPQRFVKNNDETDRRNVFGHGYALAYRKTLRAGRYYQFSYQYASRIPQEQFFGTYRTDPYTLQQDELLLLPETGHYIRGIFKTESLDLLTAAYLQATMRVGVQRWTNDLEFFDSVVLQHPLFSSGNDQLKLIGHWERYFSTTNTTLELKPNYSFLRYRFALSDAASTTSTHRMGTGYRVAIKLPGNVQFSVSGAYHRTLARSTTGDDRRFNSLLVQPDLVFRGKLLEIRSGIYHELTSGNQQSARMWGGTLEIAHIFSGLPRKPRLSLRVNNFTNVEQYERIGSGEVFSQIQSVAAVRPFLLLSYDSGFTLGESNR